MNQTGHVFQINISEGGVPKRALQSSQVEPLGLTGDKHQDMVHHGGPDKAVVLYSLEKILALQQEGHPIYPGSTGENVTITGLDWETIVPGKRVHLGRNVVLEITVYTKPCQTIAGSFADGDSNRILETQHPGWSRVSARVLQTGEVHIGDSVHID